ncbi:MAG: hypothetical protein RR135_01280 [Oscillospiraceae bacterium]
MNVLKRTSKSNSHQAKDTNLSKKIDKKLEYVAETVAHSVGNKYVETEKNLFWKRMIFKDLRYVTFLDFKYNYENRFVSISYNLELSTEIQTDERFKEIGDCVFNVISSGKLQTRDAEWVCTAWKEESLAEKGKYLERLNNRLIIERIVALDLQKIQVTHTANSGTWQIRCESMIGSSTWVLIPPVISLIKPKEEECIRFIEFFELVADALANNL